MGRVFIEEASMVEVRSQYLLRSGNHSNGGEEGDGGTEEGEWLRG